MRLSWFSGAVLAALAFGTLAQAAPAPTPMTIPVAATYRPKGPPNALVIFLSGDGHWNLGVVSMAKHLAEAGGLVIAVDTVKFMHALDKSAADGCSDLKGPLDALATAQRKAAGLDDKVPVIIAGYSSGATLAYLAQAAFPSGALAGSIALGFCPDLQSKRPICVSGGAANLDTRKTKSSYIYGAATGGLPGFVALQGLTDQVCAPADTIAFVGTIPGAKVVQLPKVGHGFGVERNWVPQYLDAYRALLGSGPQP